MKFFKIFLATLLAMVVGTVLSWVLCLIVFVGMAGSMGQTTQAVITPQTIVKIDLAENITEAPTKNPMAGFDYASMTMAKNGTHRPLPRTLCAPGKPPPLKQRCSWWM